MNFIVGTELLNLLGYVVGGALFVLLGAAVVNLNEQDAVDNRDDGRDKDRPRSCGKVPKIFEDTGK